MQKKDNNYLQNLAKVEKIDKYWQWIFSKYRGYIGKRVLDIGSGIGNLTELYIDNVELAAATDIYDEQLAEIDKRFSNKKNFKSFYLDILNPDIEKLHRYNFDTIVCIDVLEHIEDDYTALCNMKNILSKSGGHIILVVPAHPGIYNYMDESMRHYRRYDNKRLLKLASDADCDVVYNRYFNFFGVPLYYLKGKMGRKKNKGKNFSMTMTESSSKLYNMATVILKPLEEIIRVPAGISKIFVMKVEKAV